MRPASDQPICDALQECILPVLPPGAVLRFTASRTPASEPRKCQPHERGRLPDAGEIRSVLQRREEAGTIHGGVVLGRRVTFGGECWTIRSTLQDGRADRTKPHERSRMRSPFSACRLTAYLLHDGEGIPRLPSGTELEQFRQYACRHPYDADVRRSLPVYLLLRLMRDDRPLPEQTEILAKRAAILERRRMYGRLRAALRRLRFRMRNAADRR